MKRASIELSIDELILHGFPAADRHAIAAAAQTELARLLQDRGLPDAPGAGGNSGRAESSLGDKLDGGSIVLAAGSRPRAVGTEVGRAIYRSLAGSLSTASERAAPGDGRTK